MPIGWFGRSLLLWLLFPWSGLQMLGDGFTRYTRPARWRNAALVAKLWTAMHVSNVCTFVLITAQKLHLPCGF